MNTNKIVSQSRLPKTAKENIEAFVVLDEKTLVSPVNGCTYHIGINTDDNFMDCLTEGNYVKGYDCQFGIRSYDKSFYATTERIQNDNSRVFKCTLPKGAKYYVVKNEKTNWEEIRSNILVVNNIFI